MSDFSFQYESLEKQYTELLSKIKAITPHAENKVAFCSYDYLLQCTIVYERMTETDFRLLYFVLYTYEQMGDCFLAEHLAFTVFYTVCIGLYRRRDEAALTSVLNRFVGEKSKSVRFTFDRYPILWDIAARLCVVKKDIRQLERCSLAASRAVSGNVALSIGYVEAVTTRLHSLYTQQKDFAVKSELPPYLEERLNGFQAEELSESQLFRAVQFTAEAIAFNPKYGKYYYYMAQLLFFARACRAQLKEMGKNELENPAEQFARALNGSNAVSLSYENLMAKDTFALQQQILLLLKKAISLEESEAVQEKYRFFGETAEAYFQQRKSSVLMLKNKIMHSFSMAECEKYVSCSQREPYILISYSSSDYRSVYCDILELQKRGVSVVFDDKLSTMANKDSDAWIYAYEQLLVKADIVLCYIDEKYLASDQVLKELSLIIRHQKRAIGVDLTGNRLISRILDSCIQKGAHFSSEKLRIINTVFHDDSIVFVKSKVENSVTHIDKLLKRLRSENDRLVLEVSSDGDCVQNEWQNRPYHPNEDAFGRFDEEGIYVVTDGITRAEGYEGEGSVAAMVASRFVLEIAETLSAEIMKRPNDAEFAIRNAFSLAIAKIRTYMESDEAFLAEYSAAKSRRKADKYFEIPGAVCAIGLLYNQRFYFAGVGDCSAMLIRDGQKMMLLAQQTYYTFHVLNLEQERALLYREYVNNPANLNGYGVINGQPDAAALLSVTSVDVRDGDEFFLFSDGMYEFMRDYPVSFIQGKTATELIALQGKFYSDKKADDRTIIRIQIA